MKTREELEKMFDEKFGCIIWNQTEIDQINDFIFETIIVEVLKSILKENNKYNQNYVNDFNKSIKQKAKELYWIDL